MASMTVMPREEYEWTVDDLDRLPDDGLQYELRDGMLLVSPAPILRHQLASGRLFILLAEACPVRLQTFFAPVDWQPDLLTSLQPDLLVVRKEDIEIKNITRPLVLAVEIRGGSNRSGHEIPAAIGAHAVQKILDARATERAFERANHRVMRVRRQIDIAAFAAWLQQKHVSLRSSMIALCVERLSRNGRRRTSSASSRWERQRRLPCRRA